MPAGSIAGIAVSGTRAKPPRRSDAGGRDKKGAICSLASLWPSPPWWWSSPPPISSSSIRFRPISARSIWPTSSPGAPSPIPSRSSSPISPTGMTAPRQARVVVLVGFLVGAGAARFWLATPRIAIASGTAFLIGQLLDIAVFQRLRNRYWLPPLALAVRLAARHAIFFSSPSRRLRFVDGLRHATARWLRRPGSASARVRCGCRWRRRFRVKFLAALLLLAPYRVLMGSSCRCRRARLARLAQVLVDDPPAIVHALARCAAPCLTAASMSLPVEAIDAGGAVASAIHSSWSSQ